MCYRSSSALQFKDQIIEFLQNTLSGMELSRDKVAECSLLVGGIPRCMCVCVVSPIVLCEKADYSTLCLNVTVLSFGILLFVTLVRVI